MNRAIPSEVQWLQQALRSIVERSTVSRSHVEHELGLRAGSLDSILSDKAELTVAHFFAILRVLGLDFTQFLMLALARRKREHAGAA
jgi:transcriptional regulator with XRE-family HTH domain